MSNKSSDQFKVCCAMPTGNLNLPVVIGKITIMLLGVIILGLGLYSHFESSWTHTANVSWNGSGLYGASWVVELYKVCGFKNKYSELRFQSCPSISLERYFVSMIIICFILSLASLILEMMLNMHVRIRKIVDAGYHGVAAIMLLIAGVLYIVSAIHIDNFLEKNPVHGLTYNTFEFLKGEKIAAGSLTIVQAGIYVVVAAMILKS